MARNIGNVVNSINELVAELQLEKLAVSGDPGTSHPAKQEAGKANTQPAVEGARSAENTSDNKEQVTGQSIAEASPEDSKKDKAESSASNITKATFTGEDPKVEKGYGTTNPDPGTTHPAKTAAELAKCAEGILVEINKMAEFTVKDASDARVKIASLIEAPADKKEALVDENVTEYLKGYTKSAALVGELTADMFDGMSAALAKKAAEDEEGGEEKKEKKEKKAEPEPEPAPEASGEDAGPGAGGPPPEMGGGAPGGGMDEEAQALAQAAAEIAQELGCSPEEVLQAAEAELAGGGGAPGGAPAGAEGGAPGGGMPPGMEVQGSVNEELKALREKAAAYDALLKKQAEAASDERLQAIVKSAVASALEKAVNTK